MLERETGATEVILEGTIELLRARIAQENDRGALWSLRGCDEARRRQAC